MSYEKITIKRIIEKISNGDVYLPAIQRQFVWDDNQITRFFDSLMLGYPIGTFLFWDLDKKIVNDNDYSFYKFIQNYHQRDNSNNDPAPSPLTKERIIGVLDGQQRLSSLYISLQGSIARKLPRKWKNSDESYPKKELYYNLLSKRIRTEDEVAFEFAFLSISEANSTDEQIWFKVKDILKMDNYTDLTEYISKNGWINNKIIQSNIVLLWEQLCQKEIINYFQIKDNTMDDILEIFIRVNSGGTVLSKTDLLFSTIVSHWESARDEIIELLKSINKIGEQYQFDNDFIMRTCLYLLDISINLKVENFRRSNIHEIKKNWKRICKSITLAVTMLDDYGFNKDNIISYNAIIPIIYYIYKGGNVNDKTKLEWKKYFVISQVKQLFGTASNSALTLTRNSLRIKDEAQNQNSIERYSLRSREFCLTQFNDLKFSGAKTIKFTDDEIDELLEIKKSPYSFMLLSLLYPNNKYSQKAFHQDHMHPYANFNDANLTALGITMDKIYVWKDNRDKLPNLQILEGRENESKNATPLDEWASIPTNKSQLKFVPNNQSLELVHFESFFEARRSEMKKELMTILM